jgi:predicted AlkP superfamily phosphohydrolase/phosphomutase
MAHRPTAGSRLLVVGLDGATFDLIRPWAAAGVLPTFRHILAAGAHAPLRSTIPPVTPLAWSSFVTGTNPGQHGIYGFVARRPGTYDWYATNAAMRQGISLWNWASRYGRQVGVFNMPMTFPPELIPGGYMVSGMGVPDVDVPFAFPEELQRDLLRRYRAEQLVEQPVSLYDYASFLDYLFQTIDDTLDITNYLLDRWPATDLLCTVFTATDRVQHFYWRQMAERVGPEWQQTAIQRVYRRVDAALQELIDSYPDRTLVIMSDHGAGPYRHLIGVNQWLASQGWLRWQGSHGGVQRPLSLLWRRAYHQLGHTLPGGVRRVLKRHLPAQWMARARSEMGHWSLPAEWRDTQAYSAGFGGSIYLNLRGREPSGCVQPGREADALLKQITSALYALVDPDTLEPVVERVHRATDLYSGASVSAAPDLVVAWRDGYYSMASMSKATAPVFQGNLTWPNSEVVHTAEHRLEGVLMVYGPAARCGTERTSAQIIDVASTILYLLGLPSPSTMEGEVLLDLVSGEALGQPRVAPVGGGTAAGWDPVYTDAEEQSVQQRLRDLGYLQ